MLEQYTDIEFVDRENITVVPDTHVIQASQKLGVITTEESQLASVQILLAERWESLNEDRFHDSMNIYERTYNW